MKFYVGDKVLVKNEVIPPALQPMIDLFGGKICTIRDVYERDRITTQYRLLEDEKDFVWYDRNFEIIDDVDFSGLDELL